MSLILNDERLPEVVRMCAFVWALVFVMNFVMSLWIVSKCLMMFWLSVK